MAHPRRDVCRVRGGLREHELVFLEHAVLAVLVGRLVRVVGLERRFWRILRRRFAVVLRRLAVVGRRIAVFVKRIAVLLVRRQLGIIRRVHVPRLAVWWHFRVFGWIDRLHRQYGPERRNAATGRMADAAIERVGWVRGVRGFIGRIEWWRRVDDGGRSAIRRRLLRRRAIRVRGFVGRGRAGRGDNGLRVDADHAGLGCAARLGRLQRAGFHGE